MSVARARLLAGSCVAMVGVLVPSTAYAGTSAATTTTSATSTSSTSATSTTSSSSTTTSPSSTSTSSSPTTSPSSTTTSTPVSRAAAFTVAGLTDGDHVSGPYGPDLAQSVDAAFALVAAGGQSAALGQLLAYLQANAGGYVHGDPAKGEMPGAHYAGPTAKLALLAQASGNDPSAFGGLDLLGELRALMATSGPTSGRFVDNSAFGDFANPLGQAFAVLALQRGTSAGAPQAALDALTSTQCADGGFPATFDTTPCVSNTDATSLAVQALMASGADCPAARALAWLQSQQGADGAFDASDATGAATASVGTTAYAAVALTATGRPTTSARAYLTSVQNPDGGLPATPASSSASSELATAQALLALAGSSFLTLGPRPLTAQAPLCVAATTTPAVAGSAAPTRSGQAGQRSATGLAQGESSPSPSTTLASPARDSRTPTSVPTSSTTSTPPGDVIVFGTAASAAPAQAAPSGPLAYTGADLLTPVASGFVLLLTGLTLLFASRRRRRGRHA